MISWGLLCLALISFFLAVWTGVVLHHGMRQLHDLADIEPTIDGDWPTVSIVFAARNESRDMRRAVEAMQRLDYPNLEIIAVNDRSTDDTGTILDDLARDIARLRVVHIDRLPAGWLGKNHAMFQGAARATGEWLLFTDADVVMQPSTLRQAIAFAIAQSADHVALLFKTKMPSWFLEAFVVTFSMYFLAYLKPWKTPDPKHPAHLGIGGFNLIRTSVYHAIGTHRVIAMRPDDDLKLGKVVKLHGFRQHVVIGASQVFVPWYASVRELIHGLEKNAFSGVDYRVSVVVTSSLLALSIHVVPYIAVWFTRGATQLLLAIACLSWLAVCFGIAREVEQRTWIVLAFPLTVLVFVFIQWRTMVLNLWLGGIRWRDTFYSLDELRANKV